MLVGCLIAIFGTNILIDFGSTFAHMSKIRDPLCTVTEEAGQWGEKEEVAPTPRDFCRPDKTVTALFISF